MLNRLIRDVNNLNYNYSIDLKNRIIYVKVSGVINETNGADLGIQIRLKALELNCKIFFDLSESQNKISMGSAYFWFANQYNKIDPKVRYIPTAYLINNEQAVYYGFLQTVSMNQGIRIRVFSDEENAKFWLNSQFY